MTRTSGQPRVALGDAHPALDGARPPHAAATSGPGTDRSIAAPPDPLPPPQRYSSGRVPSTAVWVLLCAATAAALSSTHYLPFYDYYQWLFQGHALSALLFGTDAERSAFAAAYTLSPVPVPNLAAPFAIAALDVLFPTEVAGHLFIVFTALAFAASFGYLVRTLQGRPTAIEFLGFPWAVGFFLAKGYLSYQIGLAVVFVLMAVLHRATARPGGAARAGLWLICGLATLAFLSHLLAWGIGALAVLVHALVMLRRGYPRQSALLLATLVPGVVLGVWYVLAEHGGSGITLYTSWTDKGISLVETLQFFLRPDPFSAVVPIFPVNLLLALGFAGLVLFCVDRTGLHAALAHRPVLWIAGLLAVLALVTPISMINDLIKPDERFVLPAVLLTVAALPYRARRPRVVGVSALLAVVVLGLHTAEYTHVGGKIEKLDAAADAAIPAGAPVMHVVVPTRYGCTPAVGLTTGVPVMKWFGVDHALETGQTRVNVDETSLLHATSPAPPGLTVLATQLPDVPATVLPAASRYPYLHVIGCAADLASVEHAVAGTYLPVSRGDGYTIFRRSDPVRLP